MKNIIVLISIFTANYSNLASADIYIGAINSDKVHIDCDVSRRVQDSNTDETREIKLSFDLESTALKSFTTLKNVNYSMVRYVGDGVDGYPAGPKESSKLNQISGLTYPEIPAKRGKERSEARTPVRVVFSNPFSSKTDLSFYVTAELSSKDVCSQASFFPPTPNYSAVVSSNFFLPVAFYARTNESYMGYRNGFYCKMTTTCIW